MVVKTWPLSRRVSHEAEHRQGVASAISSQVDVVCIDQARLSIHVVTGPSIGGLIEKQALCGQRS